MNRGQSRAGNDRSCTGGRALRRWIDKGGAMPASLRRHIERCTRCGGRVRRLAEAFSAIELLSSQGVPVDLVGLANERALRMLVRSLREGTQADQARSARAMPSRWVRVEGHLARVSSAAAAAAIVLAVQAGVNAGVRQTRDLATPLADAHYQRHIDNGNLLT